MKEDSHERPHTVWFHVHGKNRPSQPRDTERRRVATWGWGRGGVRSDCDGYKVSFWDEWWWDEKVVCKPWRQLYSPVYILKPLYPFKQVNFIICKFYLNKALRENIWEALMKPSSQHFPSRNTALGSNQRWAARLMYKMFVTRVSTWAKKLEMVQTGVWMIPDKYIMAYVNEYCAAIIFKTFLKIS